MLCERIEYRKLLYMLLLAICLFPQPLWSTTEQPTIPLKQNLTIDWSYAKENLNQNLPLSNMNWTLLDYTQATLGTLLLASRVELKNLDSSILSFKKSIQESQRKLTASNNLVMSLRQLLANSQEELKILQQSSIATSEKVKNIQSKGSEMLALTDQLKLENKQLKQKVWVNFGVSVGGLGIGLPLLTYGILKDNKTMTVIGGIIVGSTTLTLVTLNIF